MSSSYPDEGVSDTPPKKKSLLEKFQQKFHKEKEETQSTEYYGYGESETEVKKTKAPQKQQGLVWWEYIVILIEMALIIFTILVFFGVVTPF